MIIIRCHKKQIKPAVFNSITYRLLKSVYKQQQALILKSFLLREINLFCNI